MTKNGKEQIARFEAALDQLLGRHNYPLASVGDLSDLLHTLHRGISLLTALMEGESSDKNEGARRLFELEIWLADDIHMIRKNLLPALKKMSKKAYDSQCASS